MDDKCRTCGGEGIIIVGNAPGEPEPCPDCLGRKVQVPLADKFDILADRCQGDEALNILHDQIAEMEKEHGEMMAEVKGLWPVCPTIGFTPAADLGYLPMERIKDRTKTHTLRGRSRPVGTFAEVRYAGRTGIILRLMGCEVLRPDQYLTDEFATADGFVAPPPDPSLFGLAPAPYSPTEALRKALERMRHGRAPGPMHCIHFDVYRQP